MRMALLAVTFSMPLLVGSPARAMEIERFDKMAGADQGDYLVVLIVGAQRVLVDSGRKDLADKVHILFTRTIAGDDAPVGLVEFERNLARARLADLRNLEKDPRAPRLEVEDAMFVTLKKNGIELPNAFFTVASGFRPKLPPKQ
jgi:hypothetical protein